ncbi:hypothetical protein F5Y13DRAFT_194969 [Hypoxylon sp. FL1857]|nr:hypothetical protein F5Y13DRAFT_194969 [Hypoxylon sp. FL1857]
METETQPQPPTVPPGPGPGSSSGSGSGLGSGPSPTPARIPSPAQLDPATHYPNGLPRSINGLMGNGSNGVNGSGSASPAHEKPEAATPIQPAAPPPATSTPLPAITAPAPAPVSAPAITLPPIAAAPLKPLVMYTPSVSQPAQPTQPRQHPQRQTSSVPHKIAIVDPPGAYSRQRTSPQSSSTPSRGFPSPKKEHHLDNPKFSDDLSRLTHAMQQSVPAAVRRVIRDNWEKCLLGSEFHHAFLLNAVIHHSNGVIIRRSIKDFGSKMVSESKHEIIAHLTTSDLDAVADDILDKASDYFLDRAMEKRLRTIDARSLINALARAERLGYENSDILEDQKEKASKFNPAPSFDPTPHLVPDPGPNLQHRQSLPSMQQGRGPLVLQCPLCWRKFDSTQPYEYHVQKQVCTKEPPSTEGYPFSCKHCGAGFTTKVGQHYHLANHVCGEHGTMPATPKAYANSGSPITLSSGNNSPIQAPATLPRASTSHYHYSTQPHIAATPVQHREAAVRTPSSNHKEQNDPYSHLTPSTREKLDEELRQAEITYTARFKEAEAIEDPEKRQVKLEGLQNSFSTKQSIIRKKYGVRLRNRRTKAEIDNERQRMGWKHNSPGQPEGMPSAKRARTGDGPSHLGSQVSSQAPSSGASEPQSNHLAVSDMNAGLGGSSATAATTDPTLPKSTSLPSVSSEHQELALTSLAVLQKKGYRVSSHVGQPSQVSPTDGTMKSSTPQRSNSAAAPIVVNDEETSDSDGDEDIPASLPPRRASGTPSKGFNG